MTPWRRSRKPQRGAVTAALLLALAAMELPAAQAQTTERVVVDRHTGLALHGVDPVAYFTNDRMMLGSADLEHRHAGAIWRFSNPGNRAAFIADPDVYMPRFGGYDPIGVARGVSTAGFAELFAVVGQRLYLFHSAESRQAFLADPSAAVAAAAARWAEVRSELSP